LNQLRARQIAVEQIETYDRQQAAQIRTLVQAESERIARTGIAQAIATEEQVASYSGPQYQVTQQVMNRFTENKGERV